MTDQEEVHSLDDVVDRVGEAGAGEQVTVQEILQSVGQRSFGPLLLVPGLLLVSPLSGVPGLPSVGAMVIALFSLHLVFGREKVWLPGYLLRRRLSRRRLDKALRFLRPITHFIDQLVRPRFTFLTEGLFARIIGLLCLMIAMLMPPLELVPMGNTVTAAVVSVFAVALVARDGLLAALAFAATGGVAFTIARVLLTA